MTISDDGGKLLPVVLWVTTFLAWRDGEMRTIYLYETVYCRLLKVPEKERRAGWCVFSKLVRKGRRAGCCVFSKLLKGEDD